MEKRYLVMVAESNEFTTKGKRYEIVEETRNYYVINGDGGHELSYSKTPDDEGLSYATWFVIEEDRGLTNVTVLKDEVLGVEREYRSVSRKAAVGERIKIVLHLPLNKYNVGDVLTVESAVGYGGVRGYVVSSEYDQGIGDNEYVVLEPTDIVRVDGTRYRMVERAAAEGERIIVLNPGTSVHRTGDVLTITEVNEHNSQQTRKAGNVFCGWLYEREYRVLESVSQQRPLKSDQPDPTEEAAELLVLQRQIDKLTGRLTDAETKLSEAETKLDEAGAQLDGLTGTVAKLTARLCGKSAEMTAKADDRDGIVERAKADVAELECTEHYDRSGGVSYWPRGCEKRGYGAVHEVEYVINREKRTVVALVKYIGGGPVNYRGKAKTAPGDCFNVWIGKAIALRRALRLPIPSEYVNAPQPTVPRVGDVVTFPVDDCDGWYGKVTYEVTSLDEGDNLRILTSVRGDSVGNMANGGDLRKGFDILVFYDDSRDGAVSE
ncbi:hypothetical protein M6D81_11460 [Paenibacillus sp. J5C_2022]|uniref:hypothetical protein n=1 Tax=Paenibacillus sp. J5C2022 TaxID=2977129 RepID=UPI0021D2AFD9|nr:hypothetical protein [Paenibacillus sp. J5C2022]MCU6709324.1 hypothetical protein [Paenibacillus sp. J5C2022]